MISISFNPSASGTKFAIQALLPIVIQHIYESIHALAVFRLDLEAAIEANTT